MGVKEIVERELKKKEKEREQARRKAKRRKASARRRLDGLARAQAWALEHFNANAPADKNTLLAPPSFIVSFEGAEMIVEPQMHGVGLGFQARYKYICSPLGDFWSGTNPITGFPLPPLWITGDFYA